MSDKDMTTIQVSKETKDRLGKIGCKGDTYDDIIQALIEYFKKK